MDTSSGLSSIASLSLGFTMSMRPGAMAFAANRGGIGLPGMWSPGLHTMSPAKTNATAKEPTTVPSSPASRRPSAGQDADADATRGAIESCRSLVVPSISLVSAPLASNDRSPEQDTQLQRSVSPVVEVSENEDISSTDDELHVTVSTTSNVDLSPSIVADVVQFQTVAEGPILHLSSPSEEKTISEDITSNDSEIVDVGKIPSAAIKGDGRDDNQPASVSFERKSNPKTPKLTLSLSPEEKSPSDEIAEKDKHVQVGDTSIQATAPVRRDSDQSLSLGNELNSKRPIGCGEDSAKVPGDESRYSSSTEREETSTKCDDVTVAIDDDDVNGDLLIENFFTPTSVVDPFAALSPPPSECDPRPQRGRGSPGRQVRRSPVVCAECAYARSASGGDTEAAPLLKNGSDSSAVGWPQPATSCSALAISPHAENSASVAATSVRRMNPFERLVRYRRDVVRRTLSAVRPDHCGRFTPWWRKSD